MPDVSTVGNIRRLFTATRGCDQHLSHGSAFRCVGVRLKPCLIQLRCSLMLPHDARFTPLIVLSLIVASLCSPGFPVESRPVDKQRPSRRKGQTNKRVKAVREVIRDVAGLTPYEKRVLDIIKVRRASASALTHAACGLSRFMSADRRRHCGEARI